MRWRAIRTSPRLTIHVLEHMGDPMVAIWSYDGNYNQMTTRWPDYELPYNLAYWVELDAIQDAVQGWVSQRLLEGSPMASAKRVFPQWLIETLASAEKHGRTDI